MKKTVRGGDPLPRDATSLGAKTGAEATRFSKIVNLKYSDRLRRAWLVGPCARVAAREERT
jgi:hypothetical protein